MNTRGVTHDLHKVLTEQDGQHVLEVAAEYVIGKFLDGAQLVKGKHYFLESSHLVLDVGFECLLLSLFLELIPDLLVVLGLDVLVSTDLSVVID